MEITNLFSNGNSCRLLVNLEGELAEKYKWYREFLVHNHEALQLISDLERLQQGSEPFTLPGVRTQYQRLSDNTAKLVEALNRLSGGGYESLMEACKEIHQQIEPLLSVDIPKSSTASVLPLDGLAADMADIAGAKATHLAVAGNTLGLPIPEGFVATANAFWTFIEENKLYDPIEEMLAQVTVEDGEPLESAAEAIQKRIVDAPVPPELAQALIKAYEDLETKTRKGVFVAMRSTAVGEDTEASFAGQYTTVLNVGKADLLDAYKTVLASKYSPRAIRYRMRCGLEDRSTPMCVAGITMIDARSSGVCYTRDPSDPGRPDALVSAIWGLGEHLVSGEASPDIFYVHRETLHITSKEVHEKENQMVLSEQGGTRLEPISDTKSWDPAIDDKTAVKIARYSLKLENHIGTPQDVEWCLDPSGKLFILQSRPLGLSQSRDPAEPRAEVAPEHEVLLSAGKTASRGTVTGRVLLASDLKDNPVLEDAVLVAKTASPEYAKWADSVKGIITDLGSTASHLASVARELGIPMLVNTQQATTALSPGRTITLVADTAMVYEGKVEGITETSLLPREKVFKSPAHQRMDAIMAKISPLNLTDPKASTFSPEYCNTLHDVIRYSHEKVVKEMFGLTAHAKESVTSVKLTANIPLGLYFIDLGGGLQQDLTTCDEITPDAITSRPMKVLWRGLSHPGINWAGAVDINTRNLMALMTSGPPPQMASYAVVSQEYVNLSIKFGYHYATVDILWSDDPEDNYISLQFGGGAGSYHGRTLRIHFLSEVLQRLGFMVQLSGDVLDATVKGLDDRAMDESLDQLGRLLASSRLLDLGIPSQDRVERMTASFFSGDYNFLQQNPNPLPEFYTPTGDWMRVEENGRARCLQDGSGSGEGFSCTLKNIMGKVVGSRYQRFLDNVRAYHYFPLAILKDSYVTDAYVQVTVTPESGCLNNMGGLVFGLENITHFFVLSLDALENKITLFQFVKGKPVERSVTEKTVPAGQAYVLSVQVEGREAKGFINDEEVSRFDAQRPIEGYVGLWTKADSKVYFDDLTLRQGDQKRVVQC